jgi:branched-chain amino acid transport system permease protein
MARYKILIAFAFFLPLIELFIPHYLHVTSELRFVYTFSILALAAHIVSGLSGQLNLGLAGFVAIGAYTFSISSAPGYPFQLSFSLSLALALTAGLILGALLSLPTARLRGDYLAIVTLGLGEIIQELLRNLEAITKGTLGINPVALPHIFFSNAAPSNINWYYFLLLLLILATLFCFRLERSQLGLIWCACREDEIAASSLGIEKSFYRGLALALGGALAALSGALYASLLQTSGEPGNYDFQLSVLALASVILGGLGSLKGVLIGALVMFGFNSIILTKLNSFIISLNLSISETVLGSPNNWKFLIFGLILIIAIRKRSHIYK